MDSTTTQAPQAPVLETVLETDHLNAGGGVVENLRITPGLHLLITGRESHATTLALTLSGRMKPVSGRVIVADADTPRAVAKHVALAGATELDRLERLVKLGQVVREQYAWSSPWWTLVPSAEAIMSSETWTRWAEPLGLLLDPQHKVGDLNVVDRLLVRVVLAGIARPDAAVMIVDDIDQVRSADSRHEVFEALARLSASVPIVVMSVNNFPEDPVSPGNIHRVRLAADPETTPTPEQPDEEA